MSTLKEEISRRRTFAIISHPDAGKTTLTEKFLLYGGAIAQAGVVKGKKNSRAASTRFFTSAEDSGTCFRRMASYSTEGTFTWRSMRSSRGPEIFSTYFSPAPVWVPEADTADLPDLRDVMGQENVKRALEIAAAGGHNLLLIGSPGAGKSMLAKRLPSILPDMTREEALAVSGIWSVAGLTDPQHPLLTRRPFRSPHHTTSAAALAGGGPAMRPGEISLAHNGVLFLDELPEFRRDVLEAMRQPLEEGTVTVARAGGTLHLPARFQLVCAMNPCRCGWRGHPTHRCTCSDREVEKYVEKISGPLLDRIDLHVSVPSVEYEAMRRKEVPESSAAASTTSARRLTTISPAPSRNASSRPSSSSSGATSSAASACRTSTTPSARKNSLRKK